MTSLHKSIQEIFIDNPDKTYNANQLTKIHNSNNQLPTQLNKVTMVLSRLSKKGQILKTPTQTTKGYYYSLHNAKELQIIYQNYLLPYDIHPKKDLIKKITLQKYDILKTNITIGKKSLQELSFVQKYDLNHFQSPVVLSFLSTLVGFIMCDGHISKKIIKCNFFLRRKSDAELFGQHFINIFGAENYCVIKSSNGNSYITEIAKGSKIAKLLVALGAPFGNKVFQPFTIPGWIYHGPNHIKKAFLSTVIGNEGSAPSFNRWRIQFVLSKCPKYVPNLLDFLNQIRAMLSHFGISTSHIQLRKQNGRQFHGRFYIKGKENLHKFYNEFSFLYASEKQEVLEQLIWKDKSQRRGKRNDLVNTR